MTTTPELAPEVPSPRSTGLRVVVCAVAGMSLLVGFLLFAVVKVGGGSAPTLADAVVLEPAPTLAARPSASAPRAQGSSRSGARFQPSAAWVASMARRTGIPGPAMRAYAAAQLRLAAEQPGCHLGWNTLAGIGWIESQHGTIGDRSLREDGWSSTTVLGPALDGTDFAAIRATPESTAWHGDPTWEHAVGPLQFITSTWDRWGADGDGDGLADPRDLDDAALTAGRYLCADAHDLATDDGWSRAVHSYNHDMRYVAKVANAANTYVARTR